MRRRRRIVAFHQTSGKFFPGINNTRQRDFAHIIDLIESWGFTWHSFPEIEHMDDDTSVAISFDDGYEDNIPVIDNLMERGISPAVFIPTSCIGKKNEWEYSSKLFPAWHFDHGVSHRAFTVMLDDVLRRELSESKTELEDITGRPVDMISFPFGRTSRRVNEIARECGYRRGFTLGETNESQTETDAFVVPRIPIYGADDYFSLRAKLDHESLLEALKSRIINMLAAGTIIVRGRLK
jgi:peptidoglycan/xylan/chitin deacetylase (PgdA/CDA1 family)